MENEEYDTIDLLEVLNAVRQHIAVLILCTLATAIAGFAITHFLITPQYESSALMIVNTRQDTTSTVTMKSTVRSNNPEWVRQVCDDITAVSPDVILEAVEAGSVKVISQASYSDVPVSPNIKKNTMLGAMVGLVLCLGVIFLQVILDNKINTEEDVAKYLDMTVVGVIPVYEGGKNK